MQSKIDKLAKELYNNVMQSFYKSDTNDFKKVLKAELSKYNKEIQKELEWHLYKIFQKSFIDPTSTDVLIGAKLSDTLYKNAKQVQKKTHKLFKEYINAKTNINDLARKLYDGYSFNDKETLEAKKTLPKYLKRAFKKRANLKQIEKQVNKLKNKPLKTAYNGIVKALESQNDKAVSKAIKVALEERARYYANRIAETETYRASSLADAKEILNDKDIKFVKHRLSTRHKITDICDFWANLDIGFGKGILPKEKMITLPLHPFCRCSYEPYYKTPKNPKPKSINEAAKKALEKFSDDEKRLILGSRQKVIEFESGKNGIIDIFNSSRPKYPISYISVYLGNYNKPKHAIRAMLNDINDGGLVNIKSIVVGVVASDILTSIYGQAEENIYLTHKGLSHLARDSKKQRKAGLSNEHIYGLSEIISNYDAIFLEITKNRNNLIYCKKVNDSNAIKIVVKYNKKDKKLIIVTAGYVQTRNMRDRKMYKLLKGKEC